jgi:hypothetical protein
VDINYNISGPILSGCYQVKDNLPSGLRAVSNPSKYVSDKDLWYVYQNTGQTISFCATKANNKTIKYYARVVSKGGFLADPAIIQHQKAQNVINFTPAQTVNIH